MPALEGAQLLRSGHQATQKAGDAGVVMLLLKLRGYVRVSANDERLTRMSLDDLVQLEALLWTWMEQLNRRKLRGKNFIEARHSDNIVYQLNAIHREVEWRAGQKDWDNAAHS